MENAKFRLARAIAYADHHKCTRLTEPLMPFLRLRGTLGAELTRYEWESAHYALRELFKVIAPDTGLEAKSPTLPKPKVWTRSSTNKLRFSATVEGRFWIHSDVAACWHHHDWGV